MVFGSAMTPEQAPLIDEPEPVIEVEEVSQETSIDCSCMLYIQSRGIELFGDAKDQTPNSDVPMVGGVVLLQYNGINHAAYIESVHGTGIKVSETNYKKCKYTERIILYGSPSIIGYIDPLKEVGIASWYDYGLEGEPNYSKENFTAASRDYPRGTKLRVLNVKTNRGVIVRVNDYGPEEWTGRKIDLSSLAFREITDDNLAWGLVEVEIRPLDTSN